MTTFEKEMATTTDSTFAFRQMELHAEKDFSKFRAAYKEMQKANKTRQRIYSIGNVARVTGGSLEALKRTLRSNA